MSQDGCSRTFDGLAALRKFLLFCSLPLVMLLAGCPQATIGSSIWTSFGYIPTWRSVGSPSFTGAIGQIAIASGPGGTLSAVYFDGNGGNPAATAMQFDGTSWGLLGAPLFAGFPNGINTPSAACDSAGNVYAAFQNLTTNKADVWEFSAGAWAKVGVSPSAGTATSTSLAIDSSGIPYVAYSDATQGGRGTVRYYSAGWITLGGLGFTPFGTSEIALAIDNPAAVYVAFETNDGTNKISVMEYTGSWNLVGLLDFAGSVSSVSIAVNPVTHEPYVAFQDASSSFCASVWRFHLGTWIPVGSLGFSAGGVTSVSIRFDSSGVPYVGYQDGGYGNKATVMRFNGTAWVPVGNPGFSSVAVWYGSFAVDSQGSPIFAFGDLSLNAHALIFR